VLKVAALEQGEDNMNVGRVWLKILVFLHGIQSPMHPIYCDLEGLRSSQQGDNSMAGFKPNNIPNS
jgi:hypothetical protein